MAISTNQLDRFRLNQLVDNSTEYVLYLLKALSFVDMTYSLGTGVPHRL